jgi:hypothetical protein
VGASAPASLRQSRLQGGCGGPQVRYWMCERARRRKDGVERGKLGLSGINGGPTDEKSCDSARIVLPQRRRGRGIASA